MREAYERRMNTPVAAVTLVMIGFVVLRIVVGVAIDRTSHNLWPFEILQVGALSLVAMGVLLAARKFSQRRQTPMN